MIKTVYNILRKEFGELDWWPADSAFERVAGAILVQQTRWESVEKVLGSLKQKGLLEPGSMASLPVEELERIVRPVGFYRQKARYLHGAAAYFSRHPLNFDMPLGQLRKEMLALKGVGKETADAIILYAAGRPTFVVDAYAKRMFGCLGLEGSYEKMQETFEQALGNDLQAYKQYHGLIVEHGKRYCNRKRCGECAAARYMRLRRPKDI